MKKYVKFISIGLFCLVLIIAIGIGITHAFFNYTKTGGDNKIIAGSLYLTLNEGQDTINLTNMFPETKEEARARNNNTLTFTLKGKNTSTTKDINYEILLNNGTDTTEKNRIDDKNLVFDLVEIGTNNEETYILDAVSYDELSNQKIWIDKVSKNTTTETEITYRLRVWVSEDVTISDSDPNADYTTNEYKNLYASVKVAVEGDLEEKILPLTVTISDLQVLNNHSYINNVIENNYSSNNQDTFVLTITSSNDNVDFIYNNDPVITNINSEILNKGYDTLINKEQNYKVRLLTNDPNTFEQTYVIDRNKKVTFNVLLTTINGYSDTADLTFTLKKNNVIVQEFVKHVTVIGINRTVPHIEFVNQTATYSGNNITPSNVVITNSDNTTYTGEVNYTYYKGDSCDGQVISEAPSKPGIYSVKITALGTGNDESTSSCGTITINKKALTPTITSCVDRAYTGSSEVSCTLNTTGKVLNDIVNLDGICNAASASVGDNKNVTCSSFNLIGDNKDYYTLNNTSATLNSAVNISKTLLTITVDSKSMNYGDQAPELTYTAIGFVNEETINDLTGTLVYTIKDKDNQVVTIDESTPIGTYYVSVSGLSSNNYEINYYDGRITVLGDNTVSYDCTSNGGSGTINNETITYGSSVDLTKTCTKSGWTFLGWNTNQNATSGLSSYTMPENSIVLYAIYYKSPITRTLTLNPNGNPSFTYNGNTYSTTTTFDMCTIPGVYNNTVQNPSCTATITMATITAHSNTPNIIGWSNAIDNRTALYNSNQSNVTLTLTSNLTLYAQTSDSPSEATITFDVNGNGGTNTSSSCTPPTVYNGATPATCSITSPNITPASNTPTIIGWSNASDRRISDWPIETERGVYTSATYYAQTRNDPVTFNVTYDNDGATSNSASNTTCVIVSTYNGVVQPVTCSHPLASAPVRTGKTFKAWKSSINNGFYQASESVNIASNVTFTAIWDVWARDVSYDNTITNINCNDTQCALDYLHSKLTAICKRATVLHTERCISTATSSYCQADGYAANGTITYGHLGINGAEPNLGDAFDCDVNGDGNYTERFYYIGDYYDTATGTFDTDTSVLVYYSDVTGGIASQTGFAYHTTDNWHGPVTAINELPTTSQWSNISLKNTSRTILGCNTPDCTLESLTTTGGMITPSPFSYAGRAARLLTIQELKHAGCDNESGLTSLSTYGSLTACNFLLERTKYAVTTRTSFGPWLENPDPSDDSKIWWISSYGRVIGSGTDYPASDTRFGIRPVIEIPKNKILY